MAQVQTKVLKPNNLRGLVRVKEAIDEMLQDAEAKGDTGEINVTLHLKNGVVVALKKHAMQTIPLTEPNS